MPALPVSTSKGGSLRHNQLIYLLSSSYIPAKYNILCILCILDDSYLPTTLLNISPSYPIYGFVTVVPALDPATLLLAHASSEEGAPHIRL